jgi:hypothetical protein
MHPTPPTFRSRKRTRFDCKFGCAATRKKGIKQSFGIPPANKNDYQSEDKNAAIKVLVQPAL